MLLVDVLNRLEDNYQRDPIGRLEADDYQRLLARLDPVDVSAALDAHLVSDKCAVRPKAGRLLDLMKAQQETKRYTQPNKEVCSTCGNNRHVPAFSDDRGRRFVKPCPACRGGMTA